MASQAIIARIQELALEKAKLEEAIRMQKEREAAAAHFLAEPFQNSTNFVDDKMKVVATSNATTPCYTRNSHQLQNSANSTSKKSGLFVSTKQKNKHQ